MSAAHAPLAPSSYGRLAYCRAAPTMEAANPADDTVPTLEGRAAHKVSEVLGMFGEILPIGTLLDGNIEVTGEMIDAATMYLDDVASELGAAWRNHVKFEEPVSLAGLHPQAWGTPDAVAQYPRFIYLWDFKYGHRYVDAFENWQMIGYSYPFIENLSPEEELLTTVQITIVQPRNFHPDGPIRRWTIKASDLRAYYNILRGWLHEAYPFNEAGDLCGDIVASPHPDACRDCSARSVCEALRNAAYTAMDFARASQLHRLDSNQVGIELARVEDLSRLLEAYRTGLEEEAEGALRRGVRVPNFTLAPGRTSLEWCVPEDFVEQLGPDLTAPRKLITPTQARDRKLITPELLDAYAHRPPGRLKLSRIDDKLAKKVFKS